MMKKIMFTVRIGFVLLPLIIFSQAAMAITLSGPITASSVTVTGDITVSSMSVSSLTITNSMNVQGIVTSMAGGVLQVKVCASTITTIVVSSTFTAVPEIRKTITLSKANNYVRVSLSGSLATISSGTIIPVYMTIFRDSTNLGDITTGIITLTSQTTYGVHLIACPLSIKFLDYPGDTNLHTYQAYIRGTSGGPEVEFPLGTGYLLLEEVSQ